VTLEILDGQGELVRQFASDDVAEPMLEGQQVPPLWVRPPQGLSADAGMHRLVWDLHYERPAGVRQRYPISAIVGYTPAEPRGPIALPGEYTVRLTVDGAVHTETLQVTMDPRVTTSAAGLSQQFELSMRIKRVLDERSENDSAERQRLMGDLERLYGILQASDAAPSATTVEVVNERLGRLGG